MNKLNTYKYIFYPDLHQKYKQFANKNGHDLLAKLSKKVDIILEKLTNEMKQQKLDPQKQLKQGLRIYDKKPSQSSGITWSDQEYQHLGFQSVYIKTKSVQRFTEVYNLLVRAHNKGYLEAYFDRQKIKDHINIISVGGGPGFELYAIRLFFKKFYKHLKVSLTTVDLNDLWKFPNQVFEIKFIQGSFYDAKIIKLIQKYDLSIMSYVLYHYFDQIQKQNKNSWDLVKSMFGGKMGMMLVNSRVKELEILDYLKKNSLFVYNLIQPKDDRQVAISKFNLKPKVNHTYKLPFLDVPY